MSTVLYALVGGVWTCPGRPDVTPPAVGGNFDTSQLWVATSTPADNGDGTWTSASGLTDNGDGTWTGTIS